VRPTDDGQGSSSPNPLGYVRVTAKSREAGLAAVQIFNSPLLTFKSEIFIVLMNIAWTYLLHAHYRRQKVEYRYFKEKNGRRFFTKTKSGANKHWELAQCLDYSGSPIDSDTGNNLRFLIGIRHEIEHQMTSHLDNALSAKFQACCLNYNQYLKDLFGDKYGIDRFLSLSLQFSAISSGTGGDSPQTPTRCLRISRLLCKVSRETSRMRSSRALGSHTEYSLSPRLQIAKAKQTRLLSS